MIDLHAHSNFSDGSLTPAALAEAGRAAGLAALALTDHDTVDGLPAFLEACAKQGAPLGIAGLEISADVEVGTLHMLGYFIDPRNRPLREALEKLRASREERNAEILATLARLGMPLAESDLAPFAGDQVAGRPHIAQAMVAKGYVKSFREAFDRFLAKGCEAYVSRYRLTPQDSIALVLGAGGVPVLAHPFTLHRKGAALNRYVAELKDAGLAGMEVFYPEHNKRQTARYLALARELDLAATGGTDFHGAIMPKIRLGIGQGRFAVPDSCLDELMAKRGRR